MRESEIIGDNHELFKDFHTLETVQGSPSLEGHVFLYQVPPKQDILGMSLWSDFVGTKHLTTLINKSIEMWEFPSNWKEALVTPVLTKGDPQLLENYRPVSCLPAASKLLEMIICDQTTSFIEKNNILPPSQHGFRAGNSTISAWATRMGEKLRRQIIPWNSPVRSICCFRCLGCRHLFFKVGVLTRKQ